jgi:hypothetical protein
MPFRPAVGRPIDRATSRREFLANTAAATAGFLLTGTRASEPPSLCGGIPSRRMPRDTVSRFVTSADALTLRRRGYTFRRL